MFASPLCCLKPDVAFSLNHVSEWGLELLVTSILSIVF